MPTLSPFTSPVALTYPDLEARLGALVKYLPQIREMGVTRLVIDGIEVDMRGMPQAATIETPTAPQMGRDPVTMGLPGGLRVPTLRDHR